MLMIFFKCKTAGTNVEFGFIPIGLTALGICLVTWLNNYFADYLMYFVMLYAVMTVAGIYLWIAKLGLNN